jgi:hypothetical protein
VAEIPTIGRDHPRIGDWFIGFSIQCVCGATFVMVGQVGTMRGCPACTKIYKLGGFPTHDARTNAISVTIGVGVRESSNGDGKAQS